MFWLALAGMCFVLYAASFTCTLASNNSKRKKQPLCWHWLTEEKYSLLPPPPPPPPPRPPTPLPHPPLSLLFLSLTANALQCFCNKNKNFWIYSQTNWKNRHGWQSIPGFTEEKHCKLLGDSLQFRLFYSLILGTISMPGSISMPKKGGFCWCLHCSKCSECQMADSHLATLRNGNSALPLQSPMGLEKEHRKCLLISRISGDRKNMFNEALRCFTEQKKTPSDSASTCL